MIYHCYILVVLASLLSFSSCQDSTSTVSAAASSTSSADLAVSTDGSCGDATGFTCLGSRFGDCCSSKGWCGKDGAYCDAGCQSSFGNCTATSGSSVSTDGSCGGSTSFVCLGSTFGDCCSENGWCGGNSSYCDAGCQSAFGKCSNPPSSSTGSAPSSPATSSSPATVLPLPTVQTTGFKVGIAVGCTVAFFALLAFAFFLLRQRRRRNQVATTSSGKPDAADVSTVRTWPASGGKVFPAELSTVGYYQELPANEKKIFGAKSEERTSVG